MKPLPHAMETTLFKLDLGYRDLAIPRLGERLEPAARKERRGVKLFALTLVVLVLVAVAFAVTGAHPAVAIPLPLSSI